LIAGEKSYTLAEIGPDFVTLKEPQDLAPGPATVVMRVDGRERRWSVNLSVGAVPFDLVVETVDMSPN
jgi:hypothetical protein